MTVNIDIDGGIAIVTIANPPVNAINAAVRERLLALAQACDKDPAVRAVILAGAGALVVFLRKAESVGAALHPPVGAKSGK